MKRKYIKKMSFNYETVVYDSGTGVLNPYNLGDPLTNFGWPGYYDQH